MGQDRVELLKIFKLQYKINIFSVQLELLIKLAWHIVDQIQNRVHIRTSYYNILRELR